MVPVQLQATSATNDMAKIAKLFRSLEDSDRASMGPSGWVATRARGRSGDQECYLNNGINITFLL
jgi:hypothetical protein